MHVFQKKLSFLQGLVNVFKRKTKLDINFS
jgi:hypothetical protein